VVDLVGEKRGSQSFMIVLRLTCGVGPNEMTMTPLR
jgi:hypothetical protein